MNITKAELMAMAADKKGYPPEGPPEVAFAGRSNAGKSSLLNLLTGRKALARVSGNPGKTRTINFYTVNDDAFRIVDLPGYGYAKVSKSVSGDWGYMIETYLKSRQTLRKTVLLVDIRHEPTAQDVKMYEWLKYYGLSGVVVAAKADKVSKSAVKGRLAAIAKKLDMGEDDLILPISSLKRTGIDSLKETMDKIIER